MLVFSGLLALVFVQTTFIGPKKVNA
jgi:hypothetical protein